MKRFFNLWLPVFLWAGVIFAFSSLPAIKTSDTYWIEFLFKKSLHVIEYMILFVLLFRAIRNNWKIYNDKALWISLIILFFYAVSDEFHQRFSHGREPTLRDVIIDISAGLITLWILKYLLPKMPTKLKSLVRTLQLI